VSAYQPTSFLATGWTHRRLILRLARRRIQARYRGSMLGMLWTIVHPLLLLGVYTLVFSTVFRARWNLPDGNEAHFALFLFCGMIFYTILAESMNEAPRLMLDNRVYIKQLRFPLETLTWISLTALLFNFAVSAVILVVFYAFVAGIPPLTSAYLPVVLVPVLLLALGLSWFLASLGTFLRDLSQVTGVLTTALLFLSPIFYPSSVVPEAWQRYLYWNPLTSILEMARGVLLQGTPPDFGLLALLTALAWLVAWAGYSWFMRTKGAFADVL